MPQSPSQNRLVLIAVGLLVAIATVLVIWLSPPPFVIWDASKSVPIGWYYVEHRQPKLHEIAVVSLDDWPQLYAAEQGYLPRNVWLIKPIAALFPAVVCRFGNTVFVDGKLVARAKTLDRLHRILPRWKGCLLLKSNEVFLIARPRDSFDSRYFGVIKLSQVAGVAHRFYFPFE